MNFDSLKDNSIVLTGFQFVEKNPLGYFEFDNKMDNTQVFIDKVEGAKVTGTLTVSSRGFAPVKDANGKNIANKDKYIVTRAKTRPVLIFQDLDFCKKYHENCFVIPIQTLRKPERAEYSSEDEYNKRLKFYNDVVNKSEDEYDVYYVPGKNPDGSLYERYLVLSDARFVHKSTLFGTARENEISAQDLEVVGIRLSKMFNVNKIEKCLECELNIDTKEDVS